jgi:hypothetical protein
MLTTSPLLPLTFFLLVFQFNFSSHGICCRHAGQEDAVVHRGWFYLKHFCFKFSFGFIPVDSKIFGDYSPAKFSC